MSKISPFVFVLALFAIICVQSIDGLDVPTLDKQCVDMGFAGVCRSSLTKLNTSTSPNRCSFRMTCAVRVGNKYFKQFGGIPQNGSACGPNKMCFTGLCVEISDMSSRITYVGLNVGKICGKMVTNANQIKIETTPKPDII